MNISNTRHDTRDSNPHRIWKLLSEPPASGEYNMQRDRELLDEAIANPSLPILRFYRFGEPTLTIGYHQRLTTMNEAEAANANIPIVRRPTGGRAILHWQELTYSVIIPATHPITKMSIADSYGLLSSALLDGIRRMGIAASFLPGDRGYIKSASCFASSSRYEIAIDGKKFIGSAQKRDSGALLQQGSILTGPFYRNINTYTSKPATDKGTSIGEILGHAPMRITLERERTKGFENVLNARFIPG